MRAGLFLFFLVEQGEGEYAMMEANQSQHFQKDNLPIKDFLFVPFLCL